MRILVRGVAGLLGELLAVLVVGVVAVLFIWVFPAIAPFMLFNDTTVGE